MTAEEIADSPEYIRLPDQFDLHEYDIMQDFAVAVTNDSKRDLLLDALNGKKPFKHFKDVLRQTGLDREYYDFRTSGLLEIARNWCEENAIPYTSRDTKGNA